MVLRHIAPFSAAKINGILCALMGLIVGFFWSAGALLIGAFASQMGDGPEGGLFAALFGVGAIIFLPLFYGVFGFIAGLITAWLYNVIAGWIGGLEVEFDQPARPAPPPQM
jgi:hypothetical protein